MKRPGKQVAAPPADDAEREYGPHMASLPSDRWRLFVEHFVLDPSVPRGHPVACARKAGFGTATSTPLTMTRMASRLLRDPRVQAAIDEESRVLLRSARPAAVKAAINILHDSEHKDHGRMVAAVVDRLDPPQSQHHLVVEHKADEAQMIEATIRLARELGVPVSQLLGHNRDLSRFGVVIEGEATEVKVVEVPAKLIEDQCKPDIGALGLAARPEAEGEEE